MAKVNTVAPAIGEKVGCPDAQNDAFFLPGFVVWNFNRSPVPADFVAFGRAMVSAGDFQWIKENARGIVVIVACGIPFTPGSERFPTERNNDLATPFRGVGRIPFLLQPGPFAIETEL